jgi:hypothetical protein
VLGVLLAACNLINPVFTITCTTFTITAASGNMTVDNTGTGSQTVYVRGYDGYNNPILNFLESFPVGPTNAINATYIFSPAPLANPIRVELVSPAGGSLAVDTVWYTATGNCPGLPTVGGGAPFTDGRINNFDQAAPFVVYRNGDTLEFYLLDINGVGQRRLVVTAAEIDAVGAAPSENTLIASDEAIGLYFYRLTTGELQAQMHMSNGKLYVMRFAGINATAYESTELEP